MSVSTAPRLGLVLVITALAEARKVLGEVAMALRQFEVVRCSCRFWVAREVGWRQSARAPEWAPVWGDILSGGRRGTGADVPSHWQEGRFSLAG